MPCTRLTACSSFLILASALINAGYAQAANITFTSYWTIPSSAPVATLEMSEDAAPQTNPGNNSAFTDSWYEAGVTLTLLDQANFCGAKQTAPDDYYFTDCLGTENVMLSLDEAAHMLGFSVQGWGNVEVILYSDSAWNNSLGSAVVDSNSFENFQHSQAPNDETGDFLGVLSDEAFQSAQIITSASWTSIDDVTYSASLPAIAQQDYASFLPLVHEATCALDDNGQSSSGGWDWESPLDPWYEDGVTISSTFKDGSTAEIYKTPYTDPVLYGQSDYIESATYPSYYNKYGGFFDLAFDTPVDELGFNTGPSSNNTVNVELFSDTAFNNSLGSITLDDQGGFFGLLSENAFQSARVIVNESPMIDDVIFNEVPEPSMFLAQLASLLTLTGLVFAKR